MRWVHGDWTGRFQDCGGSSRNTPFSKNGRYPVASRFLGEIASPPDAPKKAPPRRGRMLFNQSCFQYAVFHLESSADAGGLFHAGRVVVERDRDRRIRVEAPLLLLRHLRTHEGHRLEAVLMEPERPPE